MVHDSTVHDTSFWWVKLQQNVSMRRGTVYRFLSSSLQLLMFGNAGGIGFILGLFPSGAEPPGVHWFCVSAILSFLLGCLTSAGTIVFVATLAMKEAHAAETALVKLIKKQMSHEEAVLYVDKSAFSVAASAMIAGLFSVGFLIVGAIIGVVLLTVYY